MMTSSDDIIIHKFHPDKALEWKTFLASSNNGTLFHDLDFLSYHQQGRFDTHHLMFYRDGKLIAVLPAAIVSDPDGRTLLESPYGASVGGPAIPVRVKLITVLEMIDQLQSYVRALGLHGIKMRLGPCVYMQRPNQSLEFALAVQGFRLAARWLCFIKPLEGDAEDLFNKRKQRYVRSWLRKGMLPREVDASRLDDFYALLLEAMDRLNATPTHRKEELQALFKLVPGRLRLFMCQYSEVEISGALVLMLNDHVAYTFHIVGKNESQGNAVLTHHIMAQLAREGIRYVDMGPSVSTTHHRAGVVTFKEMLDTDGFCRDEWTWECV